MPTVALTAGEIEYADTGGDGPALVLLHGVNMDSSLWRTVASELGPAFRCVRPTLPLGGHRRAMARAELVTGSAPSTGPCSSCGHRRTG